MEPTPSDASTGPSDNAMPKSVDIEEISVEAPETSTTDGSMPTHASSASSKRAREPSTDSDGDERPSKFPFSISLSNNDMDDSISTDASSASSKRARESSPGLDKDVLPFNSLFSTIFPNNHIDDMRRFIVKPEQIQVSFNDIHVHPSTVEALDNITLPMVYPKAFSYGILSKANPPSVLLYEPPGTGKTQLVRALAKQARSKILAISSADINDKYVGVSEKMIKNVFELARSQHPCIIFIDEADCIFRSRSAVSGGNHEPLLNEFLVALDGIGSRGIRNPIVIAATNRPFDIDEGILRRLGRRIMVGMPDAAAREKILSIHLREESLAPDVNLSDLARATAEYSGSDLKNLAYSAALKALREQVDQSRARESSSSTQAADRSPGSAGESNPDSRRVLRREHFAYAKRETPPSPVADTVAKIQEFHNKYGDTVQRSVTGPVNKINAPVSS